MAIVSRLGVVLGLNSAEFNKGLGMAESKLGGFAKSSVASSLSIAAIGTALIGASVKAIAYADEINDTAKANDVAVSTVLKLAEALSVSGGKSENAGKLLAGLTVKIDEAADGSDKGREAFSKLGISVNDLRRLDAEQLFEKSLEGLRKIPDVITRNALAMELYGKAAKNVDIKGVADSYLNNAGNFAEAEGAFKAIGEAVDSMDVMTKRASISLGTMLAPALVNTVKFLEITIFGWDNLTKAIEKANKAKNAYKGWKATPKIGQEGGGFGDFNLPPEWQAGGIRGTELSEKDKAKIDKAKAKAIADAEKLTNEIKKQKESLQEQILAYDAQSYAAGRALSEVEKITLELEQGKKYQYVSADEKEQLLNAARRLDYNNAYADAAKRAADYTLELYETEQKAREDRAKTSAEMILNSEVATARLDLERQMAGASDTQLQLALEYFDLEKKILALKKEGYNDEQLIGIADAEMNRIKAQELNERAQNTFQAGWEKAYNNFTEKAKDSASLGADAFNSMADSMSSALDRFVESGKISFSDLIGSMIKDLIRMQLKAQANSIFSKLFNFAVEAIGGGDSSLNVGTGNAWDPSNVRAEGGAVSAGTSYMVGERGAEMFIPQSTGTIIPNHALGSMGGNSQPQTVYNGTVIQNMSAIDTQSGVQFLAKNKSAVFAANMSAQRSLPQSR